MATLYLIAGSDIFLATVQVNARGDIRALLLQGYENVTRLVIEAFARIVVADFGDHAANNLDKMETELKARATDKRTTTVTREKNNHDKYIVNQKDI